MTTLKLQSLFFTRKRGFSWVLNLIGISLRLAIKKNSQQEGCSHQSKIIHTRIGEETSNSTPLQVNLRIFSRHLDLRILNTMENSKGNIGRITAREFLE